MKSVPGASAIYEAFFFTALRLRRVLSFVYRSARLTIISWVSGLNELDVLERILATETPRTPLERLGPLRDGGYYFPKGLECRFDALFSPGTGGEVEFDLHFATKGLIVHQLDGSVAGSPVDHPNFRFRQTFLGSRGISLREWLSLSEFSGSQSLLLQMDIEGAEWEVLCGDDLDAIQQFGVIVIELHDFDLLALPEHSERLKALASLAERFTPVHCSPNNYLKSTLIRNNLIPPVVEVVFVRNDIDLEPLPERDRAPLVCLNDPRLPKNRWRIGTRGQQRA